VPPRTSVFSNAKANAKPKRRGKNKAETKADSSPAQALPTPPTLPPEPLPTVGKPQLWALTLMSKPRDKFPGVLQRFLREGPVEVVYFRDNESRKVTPLFGMSTVRR